MIDANDDGNLSAAVADEISLAFRKASRIACQSCQIEYHKSNLRKQTGDS